MGQIYNSDWVIPILKDLEEFLRANNMKESSRMVAEAAATVRIEGNSPQKRPMMGVTFPRVADSGNVVPLRRATARD